MVNANGASAHECVHQKQEHASGRDNHRPDDLTQVATKMDQSGLSIIHGLNLLQLARMCNPVIVRIDAADQDKPIDFGYSDRRCTAIGARAFRDRKAKVYHYSLSWSLGF